MKIVYIVNGVVIEIIPEEATIPSVAYWYGESFASQCVTAPDEVEQRWAYDKVTKTFSMPKLAEPEPASPTPEDIILDTLADHEYRLCLTELGAN